MTLAERLRTAIPVPQGMQLNTVEDSRKSGYAIAWPTLPPNRDLPVAEIPEPTQLYLVTPGQQ